MENKEFVILCRNNDNSEFFVKTKKDFEKNKKILGATKMKVEKIVEMMDNGYDFYIYDNGTYTNVHDLSDDTIRSNGNNTITDNVNSLPTL